MIELPSELVSGPDLGGGFLFQLSRDREPVPAFTYHAQEGAEDAGGPPRGSPEPLGFVHPASACMFGGPRCWHRRFLLPVSETSRVRVAYNRTRLVMGFRIEQGAGRAPVPIAESLTELLGRIETPLAVEQIPWFIGGSAAAWLDGVAIQPQDIDIGTTPEGSVRLGELLEEYLIEPVARVEAPDAGERLFGKAFLGTIRAGATVEWGGSGPEAPRSGVSEWNGSDAFRRRLTVEWNGHSVPVSPLEFSLVRAAAQHRDDRVAAIALRLRDRGVDGPLLKTILNSSGLSSEQQTELLREVTGK